MSVGFPASLKLNSIFGGLLASAFNVTCAYHVGSSLKGKVWRDVDVVVLLDDDDFSRIFGKFDVNGDFGARWEAVCLAFSALGREVTGLPIDFKVQPTKWANDKFPHDKDHPNENMRSAMIGGLRPRHD